MQRAVDLKEATGALQMLTEGTHQTRRRGHQLFHCEQLDLPSIPSSSSSTRSTSRLTQTHTDINKVLHKKV